MLKWNFRFIVNLVFVVAIVGSFYFLIHTKNDTECCTKTPIPTTDPQIVDAEIKSLLTNPNWPTYRQGIHLVKLKEGHYLKDDGKSYSIQYPPGWKASIDSGHHTSGAADISGEGAASGIMYIFLRENTDQTITTSWEYVLKVEIPNYVKKNGWDAEETRKLMKKADFKGLDATYLGNRTLFIYNGDVVLEVWNRSIADPLFNRMIESLQFSEK